MIIHLILYHNPPANAREKGEISLKFHLSPNDKFLLKLTKVYAVPQRSYRAALPYLSLYVESSHAGINRACAKLLFDPEELVVLRNSLRAAGCASLDLAGVERYREVCDGGVSSFARAV